MNKKILIVEPYFGGSHQQFLLGLQKHVQADYTLLTLPARKWKMRMQLSAPWFAWCIEQMDDRYFDTVLCSTFVDVAVLKAMVVTMESWNPDCIFCTYFHENQCIYPSRQAKKDRNQFAGINFTTALVSDRLAFNSYYNLQTFIDSTSRFVRKAADMDLCQSLARITEKSSIIYPGVEFGYFTKRNQPNDIPLICWNHRWEHDKNPEIFFQALAEIEERGYDFRIVVLGQAFREIPEIFHQAKVGFAEKILHFGFAPTRREYVDILEKCDIVVSTARHEFFGIAIAEAVRAGCVPVLPNTLSYPELYPEEYLYAEGQLVEHLVRLLDDSLYKKVAPHSINTERFSWLTLKEEYKKWLDA